MRYSRLFGKTVKSIPTNISATSHKLLYQGGFIRELSSGRYEFLPLGMRVWKKVVALIDEEMEKIGSQRISIPILQPIEFWQKSNRDKAWGNMLMKLKDARGAEFALSATGEGVITEMVAGTSPSYRDLPVIIHQFIIKIRDEMRARGGLLRAREFVMKDAYSFHATEEDFMKTYENFYQAYSTICKKLELPFYAVQADSGALGGDYCHEFQIPCEAGEDEIVTCDSCDYAANIETAEFEREPINEDEEILEYKEVSLPTEVETIPQLVEHYKMPATRFIKNVMYRTKDGKLVIATVTGNLQINTLKLAKALGLEEDDLEQASDEDLASIGSKHGYLHSWGYEEHKDKITFVVDEGILKAKNLYGGYKTDTTDPQNVNYGRDFEADIVADIVNAYEGAVCKKCGGKLRMTQSIEFGHIFKYDHFYTKHHDGYFTDKDGTRKLMWMGAYGIGIGRALGTVVELHHDEKGIIWPEIIAPYKYHLVTLGKDKDLMDRSKEIYEIFKNQNKEILWDEREYASSGEKLADADLIGCPIRIVVSARNDKEGVVEVKRRNSEEALKVKYEDVVNL